MLYYGITLPFSYVHNTIAFGLETVYELLDSLHSFYQLYVSQYELSQRRFNWKVLICRFFCRERKRQEKIERNVDAKDVTIPLSRICMHTQSGIL